MSWFWLILLAVAGGTSQKYEDATRRGITWLLKQRRADFGWANDGTTRALIAWKEAGAATGDWDPSSLNTELSIKQLELELMRKLWQKPNEVKSTEIMLNAMALTAVCHDPRDFYGTNLVDLLQTAEKEHPFTFAFRTLAICAALGDVKTRHINRLVYLSNHTDDVFPTDTQAMVSMALACIDNKHHPGFQLRPLIRNTLRALASRQKQDGSFGNVATTAITMQALWLQKNLSNMWKPEAALDWLASKQAEDGSFEDNFSKGHPSDGHLFLTTEALLALSGTGYGYISLLSCSGEPTHKLANITYTLWHYRDITYVHTLNLTIPVNQSFYETMETAAQQDPAYRFQATNSSGGRYVHTIGQLKEQPVKFTAWLLYRTPTFPDPENPPSTKYMTQTGADNTFVQDGDHFLLWYRDY